MTEPSALVSVIIPTFNYGRFVTQAVDSVLAQGYRPLEVVVVDDGSTDDTRARLSRYGPPVRYVYQSNAGPEAARNTGLSLARGKWVAFLDPDDYWLAGKLEAQVCWLQNQPDAVMVCSRTCAEPPACLPRGDGRVRWLTLDEIYMRNPVCTSTVLARRAAVEAVGRFRAGIRSEDWDLWMRLARAGRIAMMEEPWVVYRVHGQNRSRNVAAELPWAVQVVEDNCRALPATWRYRLLRRRALAMVYLSGARLWAEQGRWSRVVQTLGMSFWQWPLGFPAAVRRVRWERLRFAVGALRRALRRG
jgi:glycosyltransferase involved in cell wall biosynthesis